MNNDKQTAIIEEAFKNAYQERSLPEIPEGWQGMVMSAVRQEVIAEDAVIARTENLIFRLSWLAAGIAAILIIMFSIFFNTAKDTDSLEEDLNNLYVDRYANEILTANLQ